MSFLRKIHRYRALTWRERLLILEASLTLAFVRLMLRMAPVRTMKNAMRTQPGSSDRERAEAIVRIVWLATAHQVSDGPCLRRAITAQRLLRRRGVEAVMRIGGRIEEKKLNGHAWIEVSGVPIGDPPDIATVYQPFAITPEATALWVRAADEVETREAIRD